MRPTILRSETNGIRWWPLSPIQKIVHMMPQIIKQCFVLALQAGKRDARTMHNMVGNALLGHDIVRYIGARILRVAQVCNLLG